jgi:hypothetical protein
VLHQHLRSTSLFTTYIWIAIVVGAIGVGVMVGVGVRRLGTVVARAVVVALDEMINTTA